jgi:ankyrin repeat protein
MGEDAVMIRRIFHWLVHSKRPLTLRELSEAVSIDFRQTWLDFSAIPTDPEDIFRFCGGLVTLSGHDDEETVNLSHFSIKEFLLSSRIKETEVSEFYAGSSNALFDIAGACLTYIMLDDFDEGQCLNVSKMMQRKVEYAFLNYAALYWHDHYELLKSKEAEMLEDSGFAFFTGPDHSRSLESWFQLSKEVEEKEDKHRYGTTVNYSEYWENRRERKQTLVASCPAMYHAARLGLSGLVKRLIVNGYDVNAKAQIDFGKYDYPIIVAASGKHWTTVDLLIDAGASLNVTSRQGDVLSALARACTPEIWWLIKKVLDKGGWQLLQESTTAFRYDSKITQMSVLSTLALHPLDASEMVELFIKSGADVNDWLDSGVIENLMKVKESAQYSSPPLQRAAFQGNNRVLEVLVKAGAWINFSYGELGSPLQAATRGNRESTILRLLELDADINAKGGALGTPLQAAAWNGNVRIMTLLLNHGADVDVEGGLYGCALNAATQQKHKDAVELLLSKGANINQFCASGNAPRNTTTVERGSKPANGLAYGLLSNENFCETPLNNAIVAEDMSIVTLMLAAGACLLQDDKRCTFPTHSLCQAILMENVDMVDLLLRNGASVEVGNYCALVKAAAQSSFSILKLLFDQIEGDTSKMNSAMSDVIGQIEDETVARDFIPILERMFARNESDSQSSLVIETVNNGCFALTEFLLKHGLTPNIARRYSDDQNFGQFSKGTPLSIAILKDRMDLFSLLLHYGVDVNLADERPVHGSGSSDTRASYMYRPVRSSESLHMLGSPLFVAVQSGNVEAVSRLLVQGALPNVDTCAGGKCSNVVHLAASNHDPGMLEELLKYGANPTTSCYTCPSALMAAVKSQSLDEILMLVRKGADINEPDLFGRTPFSRAKDSCLEDATKTLLELQAEDAIPLERLCSRLEKSVELLVSKLLQPLDPGWDLGIGSHFPWTLWIHLGRCLNLGNDSQNGIIALEQILCSFEKYEGYPDSESSVGWRSRLRCCYCYEWELLYVLDSPQLHLCEDCCDGVFCEDCVERHQLLYRNSTYSHSVTDFPRQLFRDAPEGQLALDEKTYLPVQVWLEGLRGWTAKLCVIESKGEDCIQ